MYVMSGHATTCCIDLFLSDFLFCFQCGQLAVKASQERSTNVQACMTEPASGLADRVCVDRLTLEKTCGHACTTPLAISRSGLACSARDASDKAIVTGSGRSQHIHCQPSLCHFGVGWQLCMHVIYIPGLRQAALRPQHTYD